MPPVPPGQYELTAHATGFADGTVTGMTLEVEESKVVNLTLQPASVHQAVTIVDTAPELTTDRADRSVLLDHALSTDSADVRNPLVLIDFTWA